MAVTDALIMCGLAASPPASMVRNSSTVAVAKKESESEKRKGLEAHFLNQHPYRYHESDAS